MRPLKYNCNYPLSRFIPHDLYSLFSVVAILLFAFLYLRCFKKSVVTNGAFVLIVVGGLINTFERYFAGCVADPLSFFGLFYFNIFDLMVSLGLVILFSGQFFRYGRSEENI